MYPFKGRFALVTGSSRGIGCAAALALAEAGCGITINYLTRSADASGVERGLILVAGLLSDVSLQGAIRFSYRFEPGHWPRGRIGSGGSRVRHNDKLSNAFGG